MPVRAYKRDLCTHSRCIDRGNATSCAEYVYVLLICLQ